ncbi:MAG: secretin N-terminal domain-containing protein [Gammaproteobacteria bacterium]
MTLEVIPLQYRMSNEVIPILKPLVAPGGTVTGMNNQLIIKTTPSNLAEIKTVLQSLDRSPRRLLITVKQNIDDRIQQQENSLSGKYSSGDISISNKDPGNSNEGLVISAEENGKSIRYRTLNRDINIYDKNTFRVQATEGYPAYIQVGQSVPVSSSATIATPGGGIVIRDSVEYYDATSGFYVLPRLNGDRVTLFVAPRLSSVSPGSNPVFEIQNVETTAHGRLGEWIRVGGINQNFSGDSRQNLSSSNVQEQRSHSVLIKVEEIQ